MRLAVKLSIMCMMTIITLLAIEGYLTTSRESELFKTDLKRDTRFFGRILAICVADAWRRSGEPHARDILHYTNGNNELVNIRLVTPDDRHNETIPPALTPDEMQALRAGREFVVERRDQQDSPRMLFYIPVPVDSSNYAALEISESLQPMHQYTRGTLIRTLILIGALTIVGIVVMLIYGKVMIGYPVESMVNQARRAGTGDLNCALNPPYQHTELGELAAELNSMFAKLREAHQRLKEETAGRIAALEQLHHSERLATIGKLASGLAHELGTPLNVVSGRAKMIAVEQLSSQEVIENANIIREKIDYITKIIRQLLDFARHRSPRKAMTDLKKLIQHTLPMIQTIALQHRVEIQLTDDSTPAVSMVDGEQIQHVTTNLLMNAIQAMPNGGIIRLGIKHEMPVQSPDSTAPTDRFCTISIADEGVGIAAENLDRIFDPFFTTKKVGEGTGLGLSIAREIMTEHGGKITVDSQPGRGSCFRLHFPMETIPCMDES